MPSQLTVPPSDQLETLLIGVVAGDDEEPGAVRGPMDVDGLNLPVDFLFFLRQTIEIQLCGWRQGFYDVLQGIAMNPV